MFRQTLASALSVVLVATSCSGGGSGGEPESGFATEYRAGDAPLTIDEQVQALRDAGTVLAGSQETGTIGGAGGVSPQGRATYTIPIEVSPGVAGHAPELALQYTGATTDGIFGIGWNMSGLVSSIARCPHTRAFDGAYRPVRYDALDGLCLDGQRLVLEDGFYGTSNSTYRTEVDPFQKIELITEGIHDAAVWIVSDRDGTKSTYSERWSDIPSADLGYQTYEWRRDTSEDRFGNIITYQSGKFTDFDLPQDDYGLRPDAILYGGGTGTKVTLEYQDAGNGTRSGFRFGMPYLENELVSAIHAWGPDDQILATYQLQYEDEAHSERPRLVSVTKCDAGGWCLPPHTFEWEDPAPNLGYGAVPPDRGQAPLEDAFYLNNGKHHVTGNFSGHFGGEQTIYWDGSDEDEANWSWRESGLSGSADRGVSISFGGVADDTGIPGGFGELEAERLQEVQDAFDACKSNCGPFEEPYAWCCEDDSIQDSTPLWLSDLTWAEAYQAQPSFTPYAIKYHPGVQDAILFPQNILAPIDGTRDQWGVSFVDSLAIYQQEPTYAGDFIPQTFITPEAGRIYQIVPTDHNGDGLTDLWLCEGDGFKTSHWYLAERTAIGYTQHPTNVGCSIHDQFMLLNVAGGPADLLVVPAYETDPDLMLSAVDLSTQEYLDSVELEPLPRSLRSHYKRLKFSIGDPEGELVQTYLPFGLFQAVHDVDCHNSVIYAQAGGDFMTAGRSADKLVDLNGDGLVDVLRFELATPADLGGGLFAPADGIDNIDNITRGMGDSTQWGVGASTCDSDADDPAGVQMVAFLNKGTGENFERVPMGGIPPGPLGVPHAQLWLRWAAAVVFDYNRDNAPDLLVPNQDGDWLLFRSRTDEDGRPRFAVELMGFPVGWYAYDQATDDDGSWRLKIQKSKTQTASLRRERPFCHTCLNSFDGLGGGSGSLRFMRQIGPPLEEEFVTHVGFQNLDYSYSSRLVKVTNGLGATEEFKYRSAELNKPLGAGDTNEHAVRTEGLFPTVGEHIVQVGASAYLTTEYEFSTPIHDPEGGLLGFEQTRTTTPTSTAVAVYDFSYDASVKGHPASRSPVLAYSKTQFTDADGVEREQVECGEELAREVVVLPEIGGDTWFSYPSVTRMVSATVAAGSLPSPPNEDMPRYAEISSCGDLSNITSDLTTTEQHDDYNTTTLQVSAVAGGDTTTVRSLELVNDEDEWFIGAAQRVEVESCSGGVCETRATRYVYDAATHRRESQTRAPDANDSTYQHTQYTYDVRGNLQTQVTEDNELNQIIKHLTWDSDGRLLLSTTNALGQKTQFVADAISGKVTAVVDLNGLTDKTLYDGFYRAVGKRRLSSPLGADDGAGTDTYIFDDGVVDGLGSVAGVVFQTMARNLGDNQRVISEYDATGRILRQRWRGISTVGSPPFVNENSSGEWVYRRFEYDKLGRLRRTSRPQWLSKPVEFWQTTERDALGRPVSQSLDDAGAKQLVKHNYGYRHGVGLELLTETEHHNPNGEVSTTSRDRQNRVVLTVDDLGTATCLYYGVFGQQEAVLQNCWSAAGSPVVVDLYDYDGVGRKIATTNTSGLGTSSTIYTGLDRVKQQIDNGDVVAFGYDVLGRQVARTDAVGTSTWTYGAGHLTSIESNDGKRSYGYDIFGRKNSEFVQDVSGLEPAGVYAMSYAYDGPMGRLSSIGLNGMGVATPNVSLEYVYDGDGHQRSVSRSDTGAIIWGLAEALPTGQSVREEFGNGLSTVRSWDPTTLQPSSIVTKHAVDGLFQDLSYDWTPFGQLNYRRDALTNQDETFFYDDLNRLLTTEVQTVSGSTKDQQLYDRLGNITFKSNVGVYTYAASGQLTKAGATAMTFNSNGTLQQRGGTSLKWNSFDKPLSIEDLTTGNTLEFGYDANGTRLTKTSKNDDTVVLTVNSLYERRYIDNGATLDEVRIKVPANGKVVGELRFKFEAGVFANSGSLYTHDDHLGSSTIVTDDARNVVADLSYDPWGRARSGQDWSNPLGEAEINNMSIAAGFTGHSSELDVGFINMGGRLYDPRLGRFASADPIVSDVLDAQDWNAYSYVGNQPLTFTDPSGYEKHAPGGQAEPDGAGGFSGLVVVDTSGDVMMGWLNHVLGLIGWGATPADPNGMVQYARNYFNRWETSANTPSKKRVDYFGRVKLPNLPLVPDVVQNAARIAFGITTFESLLNAPDAAEESLNDQMDAIDRARDGDGVGFLEKTVAGVRKQQEEVIGPLGALINAVQGIAFSMAAMGDENGGGGREDQQGREPGDRAKASDSAQDAADQLDGIGAAQDQARKNGVGDSKIQSIRKSEQNLEYKNRRIRTLSDIGDDYD